MPQYRDTELERYIESCYRRALDSEREEVRSGAANALYNACVRREDYTSAETYLAYYSIQNPERKRMQAFLYGKCGRTEEACRLYEELLYSSCQTIRMVLLNLYTIAKEQGDLEQAKFLSEKHGEMMRAFDMGDYNAAAAELGYAVDTQNAETALGLMVRLLEQVETLRAPTQSPLYRHMQFNPVDTDWDKVRGVLKQSFRDNVEMRFLHDHPRWIELMT